MVGVGPLDAKLLRDLWRLRGQVLAIALIIASGVAVLSSSLALMKALSDTADAYYERYHFADVFADATRAPRALARRIEALPGVQVVEPRIVRTATLDMPDFAEPVVGTLLSVPPGGPRLNQLVMRVGRMVEADRAREVVVNETFALAHSLAPGSEFKALINGRQRSLEVVGIALSPEFVYAIGPGALMPDAKRYGVLWMGERALAAAYDLDGAFNNLSLTLARGASSEAVIEQLDGLLDRYGGVGAYAQADQISNWFLRNEIQQLEAIAGLLPAIFLAVAAFMSNMVLARLIATERGEIGVIKAFGYDNADVAWHYTKLVLAMCAIGVAIGWGLGYWLGLWSTHIYAEFYRFPELYYAPGLRSFAISALVSVVAAVLGALTSARRAARMPPAEAMRPPEPPAFRSSGGGRRRLDQLTRIILRQLIRWPHRSALTALGVAASVAVLMMSFQWSDAIDLMVDSFFYAQQRQDVTVGLVEPVSSSVVSEALRLPGVLAVDGRRSVAARVRNGARSRREGINGIAPDGGLEVLKDADGLRVAVPADGLLMSRKLAEVLGVKRGDEVVVELLEGTRPKLRIPVADLFDTYFGTPVYMNIHALNRAIGDPPLVNTLLLEVDPRAMPALFARLKALPAVGAVTLRQAAVDGFYSTIGEMILIYIGIYVTFACTLAIGVIYNSIRIALSERGRELATLRVLGFTNGEVTYVLLGEAALLVVAGLPLGCLLGWALLTAMADSFATELFRIPALIELSTYASAILFTLAAAVVCALLVRRRVQTLDLIAVLKTRE